MTTRRGWLGRPRLLLVFGAGFALLIAIGLYAQAEDRRVAMARGWVAHTLVVSRRAMDLEDAIVLMEADHRAFLINGARASLASRDAHRGEALRVLRDLRMLTRDNPVQQARLAAIDQRLAERIAHMAATTTVALRDGIEEGRAHFQPVGRGTVMPLRDAIAAFRDEEARLFDVRSADEARRNRSVGWLLLFGPLLGIVLLAVGLQILLRQLRRSERLGDDLAHAHAEARHALDLMDATRDGVFIYDADTLRFSYVNQGAAEQVGWSREELLGMDVLALKSGYDEAAFRAMLAPLRAGTVDALAFETVHRRKDGSDVPVEVSVRYAALGDEAPSLVTIARDITARRQAEDERDRFFSLSLDMLCVASGDGYFKRLSPAFERTLGWSIEELLARPFLDFVHPDDHAATLAEVERQVVAGEPVLQFENRYLHKDGSWRVLSWKSSPQPDGRMYATARDITERKRAEQRIVALNHELTERQVALETANRELEAFSYSVSHDLRAPLRHIDGYARMLGDESAGSLAPDSRRYLQTIIDSARRMGALIDDLLAFSRLGRKQLAPQRVDMRDLALRAATETGLDGGTRLVVDSALPEASGDPALLLQVWVNLLSNAAKYSAPRGDAAQITVSGARRDGWVRYAVRDNGVGFDMRYAGKLFGVFQRLHGQDQFEGTGVGLAIVQRILHRHGGRVSAVAEPDRGACFSFELPDMEMAA